MGPLKRLFALFYRGKSAKDGETVTGKLASDAFMEVMQRSYPMMEQDKKAQ